MAVVLCGTGAQAGNGRWSSAGPYGGRVDSAVLGTGEPGVVYAEGGATTVWSDYAAKKSAPLPDWLRELVS